MRMQKWGHGGLMRRLFWQQTGEGSLFQIRIERPRPLWRDGVFENVQ